MAISIFKGLIKGTTTKTEQSGSSNTPKVAHKVVKLWQTHPELCSPPNNISLMMPLLLRNGEPNHTVSVSVRCWDIYQKMVEK